MKMPFGRRILSRAGRCLIVLIAAGGWTSSVWAQGASGAGDQELQKKYDALKIDYDNVVRQAKELLVYKTKARDIETAAAQGGVEKDQLVRAKGEADAKILELSEKVRALDLELSNLRAERDGLKNSLEKKNVQNIMGEDEKKKAKDQEQAKAANAARIKGLEERIKSLEQEGLKREAQLESYRRQIVDLKASYGEAQKKNIALQKKMEATPKQFAEMARENKVLIKRTALMHYNLGVFYTQNKEFDRAVAEFEKAVELNPADSASYFNLGYIYAEHLQNRPKAVEEFQKFLKIAKKDDKDADWVKRYILTWQAWDGEVPIK